MSATMTAGFEKVDRKFEKMIAAMETRLETQEALVEARLKNQEASMETRFEKINDKLESNFKWLVGMCLSLAGVILVAFYAFGTYIR